MFNLRTLKAFARAPIIPPTPAYVVVPMATFRTYEPLRASREDEGTSKQKEQTTASAPSTDDIAHSDAAYSGSGPNPSESAKKIEQETPGSMDKSAANPKVSKPPKGER